MIAQPKPSSFFADSEQFTVPDDMPSSARLCQYASSDHNPTKDNYLKRLNTLNNMDFGSLVKPSPFQKVSQTLNTPDGSPVAAKHFKNVPLSKNNSTVSTCPYFLGSNLNLTSLQPKEEIDPLVESIDSDIDPEEPEEVEVKQNELKPAARKSILKMRSKSRYSKAYPSAEALMMLLPDMNSYNSIDDVPLADGEEVMYPNKYVIEVSESEESDSDSDEQDPNTLIGYQGQPEEKLQSTLVQFSVRK